LAELGNFHAPLLLIIQVPATVREGLVANHTRMYRLYREEGLTMRIRQRRRIR